MEMKKLTLFLCFIVLIYSQSIQIKAEAPNSQCSSDSDCLFGYFCSLSRCLDKCAMMRCNAQTVCKEGKCNPICKLNTDCQQGFFCNGQFCLDRCRFTKCRSDHYCLKGKCIPIPKKCTCDQDCSSGFYCSMSGVCQNKCSIPKFCKRGETCREGICISPIKQNSDCPSQIKCIDTRPDQKTCPTIYFIRKPDPLVCGLLSSGELIDFPVECYACKNSSIVYYFNTTCDKIPKDCLTKILQIQNENENSIQNQVELNKYHCDDPRPDEQTCPTLNWIKEPNPLVCGVDQNGNYIDFPVECYACKQTNIVFYYNTTCDKVPKTNQNLSCSVILCQVGYVCKQGKCVQSPSTKTIQCTEPRPNQKTCPVLYFIKEPSPLVCGVSQKGQLIDFPVQSYACKQKDILYYYNTTCNEIDSITCAGIQCPQGQKCIGGKCVNPKWPVCSENTATIRCGKVRPNKNTCPTLYFFVEPKNIVCGIMKTGQRISYPVECYACRNPDVQYYYNQSCEYLSNQCRNSQWIQNGCQVDKDCKQGFYCQDNICVDKCISTTCPQGSQCVQGNCVQVASCLTIKCTAGHKCIDGKCVDSCQDVFCIATHTCVDGQCVPIPI